MSKPEQIAEFRRDLKALLLKHKFTVHANIGWYGENEGIDFSLGETLVVHVHEFDENKWDFEDDYHPLTIEEIEKQEKP